MIKVGVQSGSLRIKNVPGKMEDVQEERRETDCCRATIHQSGHPKLHVRINTLISQSQFQTSSLYI